MKFGLCRNPSVVLFGGLFILVVALGTRPQAAERSIQAVKTEKTQNIQRNRVEKNIGPYEDWLDEDVAYIITAPEREAFLQLDSDDDRKQFIDQFWLRRNPNPDTIENEFMDEHYRRITYANEHFGTDVEGWTTDRGRIYIIWGKPDNVDVCTPQNLPGQSKICPVDGDGFPFEVWHYNYLEGIGSNLDLEFVDVIGSDDYRLSADTEDRKNLFSVSDEGHRDDGAMRNEVESMKHSTFSTPQLGKDSKELAAMVSAHINRSQINFESQVDSSRATRFTNADQMTINIRNGDLAFQLENGHQTIHLNLYGRVSDSADRIVQEFDETISRALPVIPSQPEQLAPISFQKTIPLKPGNYRLDVALKDLISGNVGIASSSFVSQLFDHGEMRTGPLVLAYQIDEGSAENPYPRGLGFALGEVHPSPVSEFTNSEEIGVFMQLYGFRAEESTNKPCGWITYTIKKGGQEIWYEVERLDSTEPISEQVALRHLFPLSSFQPGKYKIEVEVTDCLANQSVLRSAAFTVVAGTK